jgi:hypothetical protein
MSQAREHSFSGNILNAVGQGACTLHFHALRVK